MVKTPELWWPAGLGKPHLYKLHAKLAHVGSEAGQLKVRFEFFLCVLGVVGAVDAWEGG